MHTPAIPNNPLAHREIVDAGERCQLRHGVLFSLVFVAANITAVVGLFCASCPFAVSRIIVAAVVDSLDGKPVRRITHILIEPTKVQPLVAYLDTASAPIGIVGVSRIGTSLNHSSPRVVGWRANMPMLVWRWIMSLATTSPRYTSAKIAAVNFNDSPAVAFALPINNTILSKSLFGHQASKALVSDINECWHSVIIRDGQRQIKGVYYTVAQ